MPTYEIEQYELHTTKYRVVAESEAEAIDILLVGNGDMVDGSLEFIELAEDFGMPAEEHRELAEALRSLGTSVDGVIPSIRAIKEVDCG